MRRLRGAGLPLAALTLVVGVAATLLGSAWVEDALDHLFHGTADGSTSFVGPARVIDGDTLDVGGRRVRLAGIDAPELAQTCIDGGGVQRACGQHVRVALDAFIGGSVVTCREDGSDRFERVLARCRVRGEDLAQWLVANGLATAYAGTSGRPLRAAEAQARATGTGLWAGEFERPEAWRRRRGE